MILLCFSFIVVVRVASTPHQCPFSTGKVCCCFPPAEDDSHMLCAILVTVAHQIIVVQISKTRLVRIGERLVPIMKG